VVAQPNALKILVKQQQTLPPPLMMLLKQLKTVPQMPIQTAPLTSWPLESNLLIQQLISLDLSKIANPLNKKKRSKLPHALLMLYLQARIWLKPQLRFSQQSKPAKDLMLLNALKPSLKLLENLALHQRTSKKQ
jgi:hypothetical protein